MKTRTIFSILLLTSTALNAGCFTRAALVGGADDLIVVPKGSVIQGVALPTDEHKTYNVITPKSGFWISQQGWNRVEKTAGSNPKEHSNENK